MQEVIKNIALNLRFKDFLPCGILKLPAYLDLINELITQQLKGTHISYESLLKHQLAFILSSIHFEIIKNISYNEKISGSTWHVKVVGLFFKRDFILHSEKGETLVCGTSYWIVINTQNKNILRPNKLPVELFDDQTKEVCYVNPKMNNTYELKLINTSKTNLNHIDPFGHMNNVMYLTLINDYLTIEDAQNVYFISLYYLKELKYGDIFTINRRIIHDLLYFAFEKNNQQVFLAELKRK